MSRVISQGVMKVNVQDGDLDKHQIKLERVRLNVDKLKNSQALWYNGIEKNANRIADLTKEINQQSKAAETEIGIIERLKTKQIEYAHTILSTKAQGVQNELAMEQVLARRATIQERINKLTEYQTRELAKGAAFKAAAESATGKVSDISNWDRADRAVVKYKNEIALLREEENKLIGRHNALSVSQTVLTNDFGKANMGLKKLDSEFRQHGNTLTGLTDKIGRLNLNMTTLKNKSQTLANSYADASTKIKDLTNSLNDNEKGVSRSNRMYSSYIGVMTKVGITLMLVKKAYDMAKQGAEKVDIEATLSKQFVDFEGIMQRTARATRGTVDELTMLKSAALMSSFDLPINNLDQQMELVAKMAIRTGQSTDYLMESLARGTSRLSPLILDNLGIQIKLTDAYDAYALSLGKSASALTDLERREAVMNVVLNKMTDKTQGISLDDSTKAAVDRLGASFKDVFTDIGGGLATLAYQMNIGGQKVRASLGGYGDAARLAGNNVKVLKSAILELAEAEAKGLDTAAIQTRIDNFNSMGEMIEKYRDQFRVAFAEDPAEYLEDNNKLLDGYFTRLDTIDKYVKRDEDAATFRQSASDAFIASLSLMNGLKEKERRINAMTITDVEKQLVIDQLRKETQTKINNLMQSLNSATANENNYLLQGNTALTAMNRLMEDALFTASEQAQVLQDQTNALVINKNLYGDIARINGGMLSLITGVSPNELALEHATDKVKELEEASKKADKALEDAKEKGAYATELAIVKNLGVELAKAEAVRGKAERALAIENLTSKHRNDIHREYLGLKDEELKKLHEELTVKRSYDAIQQDLQVLGDKMKAANLGDKKAELAQLTIELRNAEDHKRRLEETEVKEKSGGRKKKEKVKHIIDPTMFQQLAATMRRVGRHAQQQVYKGMADARVDFSSMSEKFADESLRPFIEQAFEKATKDTQSMQRNATRTLSTFAEELKKQVKRQEFMFKWAGKNPVTGMMDAMVRAARGIDFDPIKAMLGGKEKHAENAKLISEMITEAFGKDKFGKDAFKATDRVSVWEMLFGTGDVDTSGAMKQYEELAAAIFEKTGQDLNTTTPLLYEQYLAWKNIATAMREVSEVAVEVGNGFDIIGQGANYFKLLSDDSLTFLSEMSSGFEKLGEALGANVNGYTKFLAVIPIMRTVTAALTKDRKQQAGVEMLMQSAAAFAAAGSGNYIAMASHIAAAGLYGLIAGGVVKLPSTAKDSDKVKASSGNGQKGDIHFHVHGPIMQTEAERGVWIDYALQQARAEGAI